MAVRFGVSVIRLRRVIIRALKHGVRSSKLSSGSSPRQSTISVVLCAHNEQDWIIPTLTSLLEQIRFPDEIIVVNNASTDRTSELVENFAHEHADKPLRTVAEPVKGLHHARETGWRAANGEIVVTTDADIRFPPRWLLLYEAWFQAHPEHAALSGPVRYYDALPPINQVTWIFEKLNQPQGLGRFFTKQVNLNGGNSAFRRSALEAVDGYRDKPKDRFEDQHIATKLQAAGFQLRFLPHNPVWHTFRRFAKDGIRGYYRYIFAYTAENVYPDHLQDD